MYFILDFRSLFRSFCRKKNWSQTDNNYSKKIAAKVFLLPHYEGLRTLKKGPK